MLLLLFILQYFALSATKPILATTDDPVLLLLDANETELNSTTPEPYSSDPPKIKFIDPSKFISTKENDWRDNHDKKMIIWSHESKFHPDYGKIPMLRQKKFSERMTRSSQLMSFLILGSVIGFILYTYLAHVIQMRQIKKIDKQNRLKELVHRSALIMAGSANRTEFELTERKRSLIDMFKSFKL